MTQIICFAESADMRLERAGSIRMRVGPLKIDPQMHEKTVLNLARFRNPLFHKESDQSKEKCLPKGTPKSNKIIKKSTLGAPGSPQ